MYWAVFKYISGISACLYISCFMFSIQCLIRLQTVSRLLPFQKQIIFILHIWFDHISSLQSLTKVLTTPDLIHICHVINLTLRYCIEILYNKQHARSKTNNNNKSKRCCVNLSSAPFFLIPINTIHPNHMPSKIEYRVYFWVI